MAKKIAMKIFEVEFIQMVNESTAKIPSTHIPANVLYPLSFLGFNSISRPHRGHFRTGVAMLVRLSPSKIVHVKWVLIIYPNSEGSGKPLHLYRLARAFAIQALIT